MVPKYLQTGSTDILASIRQSVLRGESNSSPSPAHKEEQTELPLVTTTKKAGIATAASLIELCSKYMSPSDLEKSKKLTDMPMTPTWVNSESRANLTSLTRYRSLVFLPNGIWTARPFRPV